MISSQIKCYGHISRPTLREALSARQFDKLSRFLLRDNDWPRYRGQCALLPILGQKAVRLGH